MDNCTTHPHVEQLNSIELIFLPPNATSHTQPMDQGKIRALKVKYRSLKTDRSMRKEKSRTNHINFIRSDDAGKGVEC